MRTLLTQAERNANYGKNAAAEMMYRQIIDEAPEAEDAWLCLARVTGDPAEKRAAYERARALAPENPAAVAGLAVLDGRPVPPEAAAALAALEPAAEEPRPSTITVAEPAPVAAAEEAAYTLSCYRHPEPTTSQRGDNCNLPICLCSSKKTSRATIFPELSGLELFHATAISDEPPDTLVIAVAGTNAYNYNFVAAQNQFEYTAAVACCGPDWMGPNAPPTPFAMRDGWSRIGDPDGWITSNPQELCGLDMPTAARTAL